MARIIHNLPHVILDAILIALIGTLLMRQIDANIGLQLILCAIYGLAGGVMIITIHKKRLLQLIE